MITKEELNASFYSRKGAAQQLGISVRRVGQLLDEGRLGDAFMFEDVWLIPKTAVDNFQRKSGGYPKGRKRKPSLNNEIDTWLARAGYTSSEKDTSGACGAVD